ncbi:MAG: hypothetical protein V3U73_12430 [bacterium]
MKSGNNKKIAVFCYLSVLLFVCVSPVIAQEEYEKWRKKQQKALQGFSEEQDKQFAEFLKKEWLEMKLMQGMKPVEDPKPVSIPVFVPEDIDKDTTSYQGRIVEEIPIPGLKPDSLVQFLNKPIPKKMKAEKSVEFDFFGERLVYYYDVNFSEITMDKINENAISKFWEHFSRSNHMDILSQAQEVKNRLNLNDWGYVLLLRSFGKALFPDLDTHINLFVWFMLSKTGYLAKVGYNENMLFLLLPSNNLLYGVSYLTFEEDRYYLIRFHDQEVDFHNLFTFKGNYPDAKKRINFKISGALRMKAQDEERRFRFSYGADEFDIMLNYNRNSIEFYDTFPQTDLDVYFSSSVSPGTALSLFNALKPVIEGQTEFEAVNRLLRFVQTSLEYKTDGDQFGKENYLFVEETLFYTYSDCEDRSILFAYLVRSLLGLHVIGLDYPGHVATAVKFSDEVNGDNIIYNGSKYVICDPTYINATLGKSMPIVENVKPKVIPILF